MEDTTVFSTSFRGYNYREVDEYIDYMKQVEKELREGCENLQKKYDTVCEQLARVTQERERAVSDCTTLSAALKKLRSDALTGQAESTENYKAKYEAAAAELEELKAGQKASQTPRSSADSSIQATSDMVHEVAQMVQKLEADARRKAEALTLAAKLEKTQTALIKFRTLNEIRSLVEMLNGFLEEHTPEKEKDEEQSFNELYPEN